MDYSGTMAGMTQGVQMLLPFLLFAKKEQTYKPIRS